MRSCFAPFLVMAGMNFVCAASSAAFSQDVLRPEGAAWSLTLPQGWSVGSKEQLDEVNDKALSLGLNAAYIAILVSRGTQAQSDSPFVLVQRSDPLPAVADIGTTHQRMEIESERATAVANQLLKQDLTKCDSNVPSMHEDKAESQSCGNVNGPTGNVTHFVTKGFEGNSATVLLHCYARGDQYATMMPVFDTIGKGFKFDPADQFVFAPMPTTQPIPSGAARAAIIGGLGGMVFLIARAARIRSARRSKANAQN